MAKRIIIDSAPDGTCTIRSEGYDGGSCKLATHPFEEAIGLVLSDEPLNTTQQVSQQSPKLDLSAGC